VTRDRRVGLASCRYKETWIDLVSLGGHLAGPQRSLTPEGSEEGSAAAPASNPTTEPALANPRLPTQLSTRSRGRYGWSHFGVGSMCWVKMALACGFRLMIRVTMALQ
jgi:hypothetical protein